MTPLAALLALWLWDACPDPGFLTFRVEWARRYQIGSEQGWDDDGNAVEMPVYAPWSPLWLQEGAEQAAWVPCEPGLGEMCAIIVTAIDEAGNLDQGAECS